MSMMPPFPPEGPNNMDPLTQGFPQSDPLQDELNTQTDIEGVNTTNISSGQDLAEELILIDSTNYAEDQVTLERFKEDILSKLPQIEAQREPLEQLWGECEDIWLRKNNEQSRYYTGVNDAYMPTGFRAIETHVQHVMSELFPLVFMTVPRNMMVPPQALMRADGLLKHAAEQAGLEIKFENFVRQAFIYGWVVERCVWKEQYKRNYKLVIDPETQEIGVAAGLKPVRTYAGATFDVIDPYDIYVHPFDVFDIREAQIVHEYTRVSIHELRKNDARMQNNARLPFIGVDTLEEKGKPSAKSRTGEEKKNLRNEKYALRRDQIQDKSERIATIIHCKFDLYGTGDIVDCKATVVDEVVIELRQNKLKCQCPPYRLWSPFNTARHIYKMGMCEIMRVLVYILNAIINQMLDANLYQTNQMMAVDVNRFQGRASDIEMTPFSIFPFGGIGPVKDAISFFKPEMNLQQTLLAANLVASTIQDSVAASAAIQGKYSSKERTKGEVDTVTAAAMTGVSQMVRSLSVQVVKKWLEDTLELEGQFRHPMDVFKITGVPDFTYPFEDREYELEVNILTAPEAQQAQAAQAQAQMQMSESGGTGDNSNPTGINNEGGKNPEGMGATSSMGTDGGVG